MKTKQLLTGLWIFAALLGAGCVPDSIVQRFSEQPVTPRQPPSAATTTPAAPAVQTARPDIEVIAKNLNIPWEIAFLPNGDMLVTERPGRVLIVSQDGRVAPLTGLETSVKRLGEGGLLGLALHPNFAANGFVYLYLMTGSGGKLVSRVERYKLEDETLTARAVILDGIPGAAYHDGGRIAFGPDGKLYATTGDAGQSQNAQYKTSLSGKILRLNDDGSAPDDNPFGTAVWSYGHRNPQGLAWDDQERLWATEHGRSGVLSGFDELNLIEKGKNYGWPVIQGDEKKDGMITPVLNSGASGTWAPSGAAFYDGSVFFAGLRGETLYEARVNETPVKLIKHLAKQYGRLRSVTLGPDGALYLTTSNLDGRGSPVEGDDRIIRVNPRIFR